MFVSPRCYDAGMTRFDRARSTLGLVVVLSMACADDSSAESGSNGSTITTTTSTSATSNGPTSAGTSTADMADSGTATGSGIACGEATCGAAEFCNWSDNRCGETVSAEGTCMTIPEGCDPDFVPVCGCDGEVHSNLCEANRMGVDVDSEGTCEPPKGMFTCGYRFCDVGAVYCQVTISGLEGGATTFSCLEPEQPCMEDPIGCECLTEEPCFELGCNESPGGGAELTCNAS